MLDDISEGEQCSYMLEQLIDIRCCSYKLGRHEKKMSVYLSVCHLSKFSYVDDPNIFECLHNLVPFEDLSHLYTSTQFIETLLGPEADAS
jgi:hypothetical protein